MTLTAILTRLKPLLRLVYIIFGLYVVAVLLYVMVILFNPETASTSKPVSAEIDQRLSQAQESWEQKKIASPLNAQALQKAQLILLEATAEHFRTHSVTASEISNMSQFQQVRPGALARLLNAEISQTYPYIWSYLLAGSFPLFGHGLSDSPIVAYYNPYFDLALMTQWDITAASDTTSTSIFKLKKAWPVTGRAFIESRASLASDTPPGSEPGTLFEVKIVHAAQAFTNSFEARYLPFERTTIALSIDAEVEQQSISIAENRIFSLLQWVSDARSISAPVNYANGIESLQGALAANSPDQLKALLPVNNPQSAEELFILPQTIRSGMTPYMVIDKNVIFIDPIKLPTAFISAYFEPEGVEYTLALALLFDLHTRYPGNTYNGGRDNAGK